MEGTRCWGEIVRRQLANKEVKFAQQDEKAQ